MPFLRSLNKTAPEADFNLSWPIDGLAYVAAFMGPIAAGPLIGIISGNWRFILLGLLMGVGISFLNAWLSDKFIDPLLAKFQRPLQKITLRIFVNFAAFVWALLLSALSMLAPIAILSSTILTQLR
jgi:hypothetical protein